MNLLRILIVLIFLSSGQTLYGQSFLNAYRKMLSSQKTRKQIQQYIKPHIAELDTVFKSYKARTGFDFNHADSLFLIYDSPAESLFASDAIIWSGKDTISYKEAFEMTAPYKSKRIITYTSPPFQKDSLTRLVAKHDFYTINHLGDHQSINDGSYIFIYIAHKTQKGYTFETCFPPKFIIWQGNKQQ